MILFSFCFFLFLIFGRNTFFFREGIQWVKQQCCDYAFCQQGCAASITSLNRERSVEKKQSSQQQRAEKLQEMFQALQGPETWMPQEFLRLGQDAWDFGASLPSVYQTWIRSEAYHHKEQMRPIASAASLKFFSEELASLEIELPIPTQFDWKTGQVIENSQDFSLPSQELAIDQERQLQGQAHFQSLEKSRKWQTLNSQYTQHFVGFSLWTLKRILGEELLKVMDHKEENLAQLALWYAAWAFRLDQKGILLLSSPIDDKAYFQWAMTTPVDQLRWEALLRLHRMLNRYDQEPDL